MASRESVESTEQVHGRLYAMGAKLSRELGSTEIL
jgi:hypothetical protein